MNELEKLYGRQWLVRARNEIQALMLELYERWNELENDADRELCAAIAFSLWRAAFLVEFDLSSPAPTLATPEKRVTDAQHFIQKVIDRNAIGFAEDEKYRAWTAEYYVNNAVYRTYELWGKSVESIDYQKPLRRWWNWALHYLRVVVNTGAPHLLADGMYDNQIDDRMPDFVSHRKHRQIQSTNALDDAMACLEQLQFAATLKHLRHAARVGADAERLKQVALELTFPLRDLGWEGELNEALALLGEDGPRPLSLSAGMERFYPTMVDVLGGDFKMGSEDERAYEDEGPVHEVRVSTFLMSATPVTWWQFGLFCQRTQREMPDDSGFGRGDRPAIDLTWRDAVDYCIWLTETAGERVGRQLDQVYRRNGREVLADFTKNGYRLPTEAEWEYAARERGQSRRFGNGMNVADSEQMNFDAAHELNERTLEWYRKGRSLNKTTPVTEYRSNALGLYDMSGNVFEWCWDWWKKGYSSEPCSDPLGPETGERRVVRGGSWQSTNPLCRTTYRWRYNPAYHLNYIGFRLVQRHEPDVHEHEHGIVGESSPHGA